MRTKAVGMGWVLALIVAAPGYSQRINEDLIALYDFTEGSGNIVHDRGPSLGVAGAPIDLSFDPAELSSEPAAGQFGDRPGLISWGEDWLSINEDHPVDDGTAHGTADAAVIWDGGPGESEKIVEMVQTTGQFTVEAWVRPASIDNRSNPGRIVWMTVEGTSDASNFVLGQQSCCDGGGQAGGVQVRLNTDSPDTGARAILNSDGFLFEDEQLVHLVHTHDTGTEESRVYVNLEGEPFDAEPVIDDFVIGEDFEGWEPDYTLAVGNDPYRFSRWFGGELHLIALHNRAFSESDVQRHFEAGPESGSAIPGDYNADGQIDAADIDLQSVAMQDPNPDLNVFDENDDGLVNGDDRLIWVHDHAGTWVGDVDFDREFNSGDLVAVFAAGLYETAEMAGWAQGDWDGDGNFSSGDLVVAFADGGYEQGPRPMANVVPEPSSALFFLMGLMGIAIRRRLGAL